MIASVRHLGRGRVWSGAGIFSHARRVLSWRLSHSQEGIEMDAETKQLFVTLMTEINELKERVTEAELRADASFVANTALMLMVSVTAGALDNETKDRGKRLFSILKNEFHESPDDHTKEVNAAVLLQAEEYVDQFFARVN